MKHSFPKGFITKDGSTARLDFAYFVPRTLNRTVPAYRTSVQFLKRTVLTYRFAILVFNYSQLKLSLKSLAYILAISMQTFSVVSAVFCLHIQKADAMCEKSGIFNSKSVPTYRTRTFKKRRTVPIPLQKKRTVLLSKN